MNKRRRKKLARQSLQDLRQLHKLHGWKRRDVNRWRVFYFKQVLLGEPRMKRETSLTFETQYLCKFDDEAAVTHDF